MKDNFLYYQLMRDHRAMSVMIATKHSRSKALLFEDPKTKRTRALRYASNKESIFEDEQEGHVILEPIIFEDGVLKVDKKRHNLVKFLEHHPDNAINGGSLFKLRDFEAEAEDTERMLEIEYKAQDLSRKLTDDQYKAIHRTFSRDTDKLYASEIRKDVKLFARNNPVDFLDMIEDPSIEMNNIVATAIDENLVTFRRNNKEIFFNLKGNKKMITRVPEGVDHIQHFQEYLDSNDGLEDFKTLEEAVSEL